VLSQNPWAQKTYDNLTAIDKINNYNIKNEISMLDDIEQHVSTMNVKLPDELKKQMQQQRDFLLGRANADGTMTKAIAQLADRPDVSIVAVIIGAAHTPGMVSQLKEQKRPFAVITANAFSNGMAASRVDYERLKAKYAGVSVAHDAASLAAMKAFPTKMYAVGKFKPEPVISQDWFQAKAEAYLLIDQFTKAELKSAAAAGGGGGPGLPPPPKGPGGGPSSPSGPPEKNFRAQLAMIDYSRREKRTRPDGRQFVVYPLIYNPNDPARKTEVWVASYLTSDTKEGADEERALTKALSDAMSEDGARADKSDKSEARSREGDKSGKESASELGSQVAEMRATDITTDVKAIMGATKEDVIKVAMAER
jgi:hypothetical protein